MDKIYKKKILLLSGYDAASHRYWRETLATGLDKFDWTQIGLPDRYFNWRIRGNSLTFAFQHQEKLARNYDALVVTSMVDLASLRGFIPQLAKLPTLVYFHENQFDYPESSSKTTVFEKQNRVNAQLTSIYSLLCADKVLFNSEYNLKTFFSGAKKLLEKLPDGIETDLLEKSRQLSSVLAVPISDDFDLKMSQKTSLDTTLFSPNKVLEIVWNHRWEHDKQPEVLFEGLLKLRNAGYHFKLHILGQSFREKPECFNKAKKDFDEQIVSWGFQPKARYREILQQADIVISTALHDFQGLSMIEAIAAGCFAIAPNRVAYPEYIAKDQLYEVGGLFDEAESLYRKLIDVIGGQMSAKKIKNIRQNNIRKPSAYYKSSLLSCYEAELEKLIRQEPVSLTRSINGDN